MTDQTGGDYVRCPKCYGGVALTQIVVRTDSLRPIPRVVESFMRITKWQCLRFAEHSGEYCRATNELMSEPSDD